MRTRSLGATLAVLALAAGTVLTSGGAAAAARAESRVTIKAEGTDLSGKVFSPRPARCADERKVLVFRQFGSRGGGDDEKMFTDISEKQGDDYVWSTGNTGQSGRFYAKVRRTADWKANTSRTIRVEPN
jgi:hypothetical protein